MVVGKQQSAGVQGPPSSSSSGQQKMAASGVAPPVTGQPTAGPGGKAQQGKMATAHHSSEVLGQTKKLGTSPVKLAAGGVAVVFTLAYFTLYSHKKPEATALDVAKVASGTATTQNTRPRT